MEVENNKCVICGLILDIHIVVVKEKGLLKFIESSITRADGKTECFKDRAEIKLHKSCRISYNNPKCIESEKKRKQKESGKESESISEFDFQNKCLFCDKDSSLAFEQQQKKYPTSSRISVGQVKKLDTQKSILQACTTHDDDWSRQVLLRMDNVNILEKNARYHYRCYSKFCHSYRAAGLKRGRQRSQANVTAMDQVYDFIEAKFPPCDECKKPVGARELYRCVQCPLVVMCADCGRRNAHAHHCVLRMPSLQIYNKVEHLFELLTDVFHKKLTKIYIDDNTNDDDDDNSNDDDEEEEMKHDLEISVNQEQDDEKHNQTLESAISGPTKQRKSSVSTFLPSGSDETFAPEPPDEAIPTPHIMTEPDTDPLACRLLFNILHTPTDEPKPKKRRTLENIPKNDYGTDEIKENIKRDEEHEEVVNVKLEPLDSDAILVDTEKYATYGSHRAGNTDL